MVDGGGGGGQGEGKGELRPTRRLCTFGEADGADNDHPHVDEIIMEGREKGGDRDDREEE